MKRLLIIGCGDVVRRALPTLLSHWRVLALVRRHDPALQALGIAQIVGDLDQPRSLGRLAGIADAVIHSAPPPGEGAADPRTARLLAVLGRAKSLPRSVVYIGTTGVYGDCGGDHIEETRPLAPRSARTRRRADAERRLREFGRRSGCRVTLLRAPGIYAPDRLPLDRLRQGTPVPLPEEDAYSNHIHADDLARACIAALRRGRPNRVINVVDDTELKMGDWFDKLADAFALPRPPRLPYAEMERHLTPMQRSFMGESRRIANRRLKTELHSRLHYPTVEDGIAAALKKSQGAS
ncbi:MAG TPA: SDR family oxidoreductase [Rhodocyclaceae bacterium]|nr:SDR family oxidoreductase [Rhodocyclaceae bacterium]